MKHILRIALKDIRQVLRDRMSLMFLLIMPIAFTLMFGFFFGGSTSTKSDPRLPVGYLDLDNSRGSAELKNLLQTSTLIRLEEKPQQSSADLEKLVGDEKLAGALVVPAGYGNGLANGFSRGVTVNFFGAFVPTDDYPIQCFADNCIIRRIHDGCKLFDLFLCLPASGHFTDITLDHGSPVHQVDIRRKIPAAPGRNGYIQHCHQAMRFQFRSGLLEMPSVFQEADLPKILRFEGSFGIAQQILGRQVGVYDLPGGLFDQQHAIIGGFESPVKAFLGSLQDAFQLPALSDILKSQQDPLRFLGRRRCPPGIQQQDPRSDGWKVVFHHVIIECYLIGQDCFQQSAQGGDIPLPVSQVVDLDTHRILLFHLE